MYLKRLLCIVISTCLNASDTYASLNFVRSISCTSKTSNNIALRDSSQQSIKMNDCIDHNSSLVRTQNFLQNARPAQLKFPLCGNVALDSTRLNQKTAHEIAWQDFSHEFHKEKISQGYIFRDTPLDIPDELILNNDDSSSVIAELNRKSINGDHRLKNVSVGDSLLPIELLQKIGVAPCMINQLIAISKRTTKK